MNLQRSKQKVDTFESLETGAETALVGGKGVFQRFSGERGQPLGVKFVDLVET